MRGMQTCTSWRKTPAAKGKLFFVTDNDDELEWIEFPPDEEATVLTSISPQCLEEGCLHCPGVFEHPMLLVRLCFACTSATK